MDEIIIRERELKEELVNAINKSNLPALILAPILESLLGQVNILKEKEYNQALENRKEKEKETSEDEKN